MLIFPAIDLYEKKAVRLLRGDYAKMTVYSEEPWLVAKDFKEKGATWVHLVDLEGAKNGDTPNFDVVARIKSETGLFCEIGGGIRSMDVCRKYIEAGIDRIILGTAAVKDEAFVREAVAEFGEKIAVGVDIKDGYAAISGWTEKSDITAFDLCRKMQSIGVKTLICTDISKDGAMQGTNRELYRDLQEKFDMNIVASGGVSTIDDIKALSALSLYGAIVGKAYYTGAIDLKEAIEVAR